MKACAVIVLLFLVGVEMNGQHTTAIKLGRQNATIAKSEVEIDQLVQHLNTLGQQYVDTLEEYEDVLRFNRGHKEKTGQKLLDCTPLQYAEEGSQRVQHLTDCHKIAV